jgi:hypothetical protein
MACQTTTDLVINQGETWKFKATWKDTGGTLIDLTGYTIRSQVRPYLSSSTILFQMNSATPSAGVSFEPLDASGEIEITLSANFTAALSFDNAVYDMEAVSPSGQVTRILQGGMTLSKEVTR